MASMGEVEKHPAEALGKEKLEKQEAAEISAAEEEQQPTETPAAEEKLGKQDAKKKSKACRKNKGKASREKLEMAEQRKNDEKPYVYDSELDKKGKSGSNNNKKNKKNKKSNKLLPLSHEQAEAIMDNPLGFGLVTEAMREEAVNKGLYYLMQIYESQGFDIDNFPRGYKTAPIVPYLQVGDEDDEWLNDQCRKPIAKYNSLNGSCYEFVNLEKANLRPCAGFVSFLTFQARKPRADSLVTFQARYYDAVVPKHSHVQVCRIKQGASKPTPAAASGPVEGVELNYNMLTDVFDRATETGLVVNVGEHQSRRVRVDGYQHLSADEVDEETVKRQIRTRPIAGVLDYYPSLYKEFKGKGVYCGPTEEECRRRDKKLQRDENYITPSHCVLLYSYGVDPDTGEAYYAAKNCWGIEWANGGFGKIKTSLFSEFVCLSGGLRVE